MKTLDTAYRVTDLAVSLDFYSALGDQEVGRISLSDGATLTVLTATPRLTYERSCRDPCARQPAVLSWTAL